jgi:hypothetical protein
MQRKIFYISVAYLTDHIPFAYSWQESFDHASVMEFKLVHYIQVKIVGINMQ